MAHNVVGICSAVSSWRDVSCCARELPDLAWRAVIPRNNGNKVNNLMDESCFVFVDW